MENLYIPCPDCKMRGIRCSSCKISKYDNLYNELEKEKSLREAAEFKVSSELEPRIRAEKYCYDTFITTDKSAEWGDGVEYEINLLVEMFDEDFVQKFDFSGDTLFDKIARLILLDKKDKENK